MAKIYATPAMCAAAYAESPNLDRLEVRTEGNAFWADIYVKGQSAPVHASEALWTQIVWTHIQNGEKASAHARRPAPSNLPDAKGRRLSENATTRVPLQKPPAATEELVQPRTMRSSIFSGRPTTRRQTAHPGRPTLISIWRRRRANRKWEQYCEKMSCNAVFGGTIELYALAEITGRRIRVFNKYRAGKTYDLSLDITPKAGAVAGNAPINLVRHSDCEHYNFLAARAGERKYLAQAAWRKYLCNVPGDGDCLFHAVGMGAGQSGPQLRAMAVAWMRQFGQTFAPENLQDLARPGQKMTLARYQADPIDL